MVAASLPHPPPPVGGNGGFLLYRVGINDEATSGFEARATLLLACDVIESGEVLLTTAAIRTASALHRGVGSTTAGSGAIVARARRHGGG
jgi:hypothetical protein